MTLHTPIDTTAQLDKLAKAASALGFEIVDISGFLDLVEGHSKGQRRALGALGESAAEMADANEDVAALVDALAATSDQALRDVKSSVTLVRSAGDKTRDVAGWVTSLSQRTATVSGTLRAVKENNGQIAAIAMQVNTLAINAKIEAARAGDAGRGFAVVANAINELSQKTSTAAKQISQNIEALTNWVDDLGTEAETIAKDALIVLDQSSETDTALTQMESTIQTEHQQAKQIETQINRSRSAMRRLHPAVQAIDGAVRETSGGIEATHARMFTLIDASEGIVQSVAGLGGVSGDAPFVTEVRLIAENISKALDRAIDKGHISMAQLFDRNYTPIPHTNPPQVMTKATRFLDQLLPSFQEPALEFDPKVIFCAAVDINGYLPTHNHKFSQVPSEDVIWNTANCRNRRIFDDRVGLKAGRSTAPFLLQVYRRDMGGGDFRVMKDLSAPIRAGGHHWGGLRLAYRI
ncbi:MAG: methyl-accepting chemotaxis protein [Sulfitobacter sp.]